jgi:hypothetical protein
LPAADKSPEFAGVIDKEPRGFRDEAALKLLLDRVRKTPPAALSSMARSDVLPANLLMKAYRYRGLPIHLDGFASKVFALDDQDPGLVASGRLYEVWIRPAEHDQRLYPCCVLLEDAPPTLPAGRDLDEAVSFDGYFLKLLAYRAGDSLRYAPMLVGRLRHAPDATGPFNKSKRSWVWTYVPVGLLMVYVTARLFFRLRKSLPSLATRPRFSAAKDRIEPEQLDEWLANPSSDEP